MRTYGVTHGLVRRIAPALEVRVIKCLLAAHRARGVEAEHLRKEVDSESIRGWEEPREWHARFYRERFNIVLSLSTNHREYQCRIRYNGRDFRRLHVVSRHGEVYPLMGFRDSAESG